MTISKNTNSVTVVKCTCGAGDAETLRVLRATSLADASESEFNEIVGAVNKAGGIVKTTGLWRMLISKAIQQHQDGVAKGDYVGHPFRGNQHADASGASRGGAGGPRSGKPSRIQSRQGTSEIEELNAQLDLIGDRKLMFDGLLEITRGDLRSDANPQSSDFRQPLGTLQQAEKAGIDTPEGRKLLERARDEFEDKNHHAHAQAVQNVLRAKGPATTASSDNSKKVGVATDYVLSQIQMIMESDEDDLKDDEAGINNLRRAAESDEQQAVQNEEMLRESPDGASSAKEIKAASRRAQAKADLAEALNETQKDIAEARKVLAATRAKADKESDPRKVGGVLSSGVRRAIGILEARRQNLQLESEAARANDKAGRGGGTGVQYGLPLSALQDRISSLREIEADSRRLNASVDELMSDEVFAEILEDQS